MGTPPRLGAHRLLGEIGRGGTAVVHSAIDAFGREVVVKRLRPEIAADPAARRRLAREIAAQRRVRSPYVPRLLDGRADADPPYLVMAYAPGCPLSELVAGHGPPRPDRLRRLARRLALAVAAVHDAGVLHRDVSPGNVMVHGERPALIDFGLAHDAAEAQTTRPGMVVGTPAYLAPEVIEGGPATAASDVFAWAATIAFAATGRPPFGRGPLEGVCLRIVSGTADLEGVEEPLAGLLRLGLDRDPRRRPSARWFAGALAPAGMGAPGRGRCAAA